MDEGVGRRGSRAALLAAAAVCAAIALPAPAAGEDDPLSRYAPMLRYSVDEDYYARPVGEHAGERDLVYGHEVSQDGDRYLQYWLFYDYNDQDRGILRTGLHEGDWEFVQVRLGPAGEPAAMTFAQHSVAERCEWSEIETTPVNGDAVPVVYVANGSRIGRGRTPTTSPTARGARCGRRSRRSPTSTRPGCSARSLGAGRRRAGSPASSRARSGPSSRPTTAGTIPPPSRPRRVPAASRRRAGPGRPRRWWRRR